MNKAHCLLDAGLLVSFLASEAAFLLKRDGRDTDALFELLERGVIGIALAVQGRMCEKRLGLVGCTGRALCVRVAMIPPYRCRADLRGVIRG